MKMKKLLLLTASALSFASVALATDMAPKKTPVASDLTIKIKAYADFEAASRNQSKLKGDEKNVSKNKKQFAFYNSAAMLADLSNEVNDITYGAKIVMVPTAKKKGGSAFNGTHIYVQSDFGRIEAGSPVNAAKKLMVSDGSISAGSSNWDRYADFSVGYLKNGSEVGPSFATMSEFFLGNKLTSNIDDRKYSTEPARAIVYYTPKFELGSSTKVQAGISYIPDSSNTGADSHSKHSSGVSTRKLNASDAATITGVVGADKDHKFEVDRTVKDAFSGGIVLEQNLSDGVDAKIGVSGEYGQAAGKIKLLNKDGDTVKELKLKNLRTYNIGAVLTVGNFSCGGAFGSLGKSLTSAEFHRTGRDTTYYSSTVAYRQGPFAASVSYFKSMQFKNTVDAITIGTDYKLAPGFKPYAEFSTFATKGRPEFRKDLEKRKSRGTVALIGAKLSL